MKVSDLRGILQYVPRFRDRIFVLAIDGEVAASENFPNLLLDIAVLRSLSIKVAIVHGAGHQIQKVAGKRNVTLSNFDGTGITDEETLKISLDAATRLTHEIMEGLTAVDLRAAYANCVIAHPAGILGGQDYLFTGKVEKIDTPSLELFLNEGIVPVIPPLGFDGEGKTYRVNSDAIAVEVAEAVRAAKIIFLTPQPCPVMIKDRQYRQISISETEELLKSGSVAPNRNIESKLEYAARACRQGVQRVHLLNGNENEALLAELFSNEGIGTMVYSNEYEQIRRVYKKDVRAVMNLIRQSVQSAELIRRTRTEILSSLEDYWVMEIDRNLVGCAALHIYPEASMAELACLYVSRSHENRGYGRRLMAFIENLAREKGVRQIFALSTQAFAYLQQKGGFQESGPDILPLARREKYETSGRNSKVLIKAVQAKAR